MLSDKSKRSSWWSFFQVYSAKRRYVPPSCCWSESSGIVLVCVDDDRCMDDLLQDIDVDVDDVMAKDSVCCTINANAIITMQHTTVVLVVRVVVVVGNFTCTCEQRECTLDLSGDNFIDWLVRFSKMICYKEVMLFNLDKY